MSYSIRVHSRPGGLSVETSGDVPEGEHELTGHDDGRTVSIAVRQRDAEGRFVVSAQHSHDRET